MARLIEFDKNWYENSDIKIRLTMRQALILQKTLIVLLKSFSGIITYVLGKKERKSIEASLKRLTDAIDPLLHRAGPVIGHKIDMKTAEEIRLKYKTGTVTQKQLGKEFGLNPTMISMIVRDLNW